MKQYNNYNHGKERKYKTNILTDIRKKIFFNMKCIEIYSLLLEQQRLDFSAPEPEPWLLELVNSKFLRWQKKNCLF